MNECNTGLGPATVVRLTWCIRQRKTFVSPMRTVSVILKMIQRALSSLNITVLPNFLFVA